MRVNITKKQQQTTKNAIQSIPIPIQSYSIRVEMKQQEGIE